MKQQLEQLAHDARDAYRALSTASAEARSHALLACADAMAAAKPDIVAANKKDMDAATHLDAAMRDRLLLDEKRIDAIIASVRQIAAQKDPLGRSLETWQNPANGLRFNKVAVPLGVIGMIYESRPNVTADAAALCLRSGNAVILRGGSESAHSSRAIVAAIHAGLKKVGLPTSCVQLVPTQDREAVGLLLKMHGLIDVIIPRGGASLTARVAAESSVPTLLHLTGNCHTYIHAKANPDMATRVLHNAKLRRTGVCGATESLIIDAAIAPTLLPRIVDDLKDCELRGDAAARAIDARIGFANEEDWGTEYLAPILSVKVVGCLEEAIEHINYYGSHHTDAILTEDAAAAKQFAAQVDSAIVVHNASTQFADGGEFGFGAEIGIATGRLHARGPVGAAQLTTYKYVVEGDGTVRA
ncbi:MAG: glutamate-5-semialdehyde dehydrogenase [Alphaproteobacteria bacterium]|nr:glutamate-5-semialdehyde dehydrogenase [Alphaproteobacteria bacterium]